MKIPSLLGPAFWSLASLSTAATGGAVTIHVSPADGAGSLQAAIDRAQTGDVIRVGAGRYLGILNFAGKRISLVGEGPKTILDGNGRGPVVRFEGGGEQGAVLDSVQITGGRAEDGAGILISDASPTIRRSVIFRNAASGSGAGILVTGSRANPSIQNNLVAYNRDRTPGFTDAHQIFIDSGSSARIFNNTIVRGNGNAILISGSRRPSLVLNNILAWNGSTLPGGTVIGRGICDFSGSARIHYNLFFQNSRAALLTDGPDGAFEDYPTIGEAQAALGRGRVTRNFDANPRLPRPAVPPAPDKISPKRFVPRSGPAIGSGDPRPGFRNPSGSRNTTGHTGGPFGWR